MDIGAALLLMSLIYAGAAVAAVWLVQRYGNKRKVDDNMANNIQMESVAKVAEQVGEVSKQALRDNAELTKLAIGGMPDKTPDKTNMQDLGWVDSMKEGNGQQVQRPVQYASSAPSRPAPASSTPASGGPTTGASAPRQGI